MFIYRKRPLRNIEPQVSLALGGVPPVTLETSVRQDRTNVLVEGNRPRLDCAAGSAGSTSEDRRYPETLLRPNKQNPVIDSMIKRGRGITKQNARFPTPQVQPDS